jgi:hypothetical protein
MQKVILELSVLTSVSKVQILCTVLLIFSLKVDGSTPLSAWYMLQDPQ